MAIAHTPSQLKAINHRNGNLLIIACAGSGKTEVIARRIALLVQEGTDKSAIIAFTFTERAASELKARIRRHLEELLPDDPSLGDMYVGTIHSFCLQLLKWLDPQYRSYEVMDEARQAALISSNYFLNKKTGRGIGLNLVQSRTKTGRYWETVRWFINTLNVIHQRGIPLSKLDPETREVVTRYNDIARNKPNYFLDFNAIIDELLQKLKNDKDALDRVRAQFKYLVVDEYQDTDGRQEELIDLISNRGKKVSVTVVGDDDQAIYGWRGASIDNILKFEKKYPGVTKVELTDNFRSTHAVVEIANSAINRLPVNERIPKGMNARRWKKDGKSLIDRMADSGDVQRRAFSSDQEEAAWVADRIAKLHGVEIEERDGTTRAITYADMAILLRSVKSSGAVFAQALRDKKIPVVIRGTKGLFDQDEIRIIQATFCLLAREELFFVQDDGQVQKLAEPDIRELIRTKIDLLRDNKFMPGANATKFLGWIAERRATLDQQSLPRTERGTLSRRVYPQDMFQEILEQLGAASGTVPWPADILYNLGRFSSILTQFEAVHQWITPYELKTLCFFLGGWAAATTDEGGIDEIATPNAVQVMTVHAAKGLEWPVVFLPRVSSSNFPSSRRSQGPDTFIPSGLFNRNDYASGDSGERRLWYVGVTRCRKFLHVSSQDRPRKRPTDYFTEIKHDCMRSDGKDPTARAYGTPTPPANSELLPTTFSDLKYFWNCPFEYQLRALMGFRPGVKESYGYGQQIHNILAEVHDIARSGKKVNAALLEKIVDERFNLRYTRNKPLELLKDAAKLSLLRYFEKFKDQQNRVVATEKQFEYLDRDSGALITGTIDLLERFEKEPGGDEKLVPVAVIDFKTHKWQKIEDYFDVKAAVEKQLRLYAAAAKHALGMDPKAAKAHILSPKAPNSALIAEGASETITVDVSEAQQTAIRNDVKTAISSIRSNIAGGKTFPMLGEKTRRCPNCDFRQICPGSKKWRKADKSSPNPLSYREEREAEISAVEEDVDAG